MQVRLAVSNDISELTHLLTTLFSQEAEFSPNEENHYLALSAIIEGDGIGDIFVARDNGQIVGMVSLLYSVSTALGGRVAMLEDMVVLPEYRQRGVGSQLLHAAIAVAESKDCRRITLLTDNDNVSAQMFYAEHGFTMSSMRPYRILLGSTAIH